MADVLRIEGGVLVECADKSAVGVAVPEGVTEIGEGAFFGCKSLETMEFGGTAMLPQKQ